MKTTHSIVTLLSILGTLIPTVSPAETPEAPPALSASMADLKAAVRLLFDEYMRDPSICLGPVGTYYLPVDIQRNGQVSLRKEP